MPDSPPLFLSTTRLPKPAHRRTHSSITPEASRNSSLQTLWAEDYYTDETSLGEISPPPPATLTSRPYPRSIPLTAEEESHPARQPRTHKRSLTELLPFRPSRPNSTSPHRSPIREIAKKEFEDEFMPTLTGDRDRIIRVSDKSRGGLSGWFSGASAPMPLGVPAMEPDVPSPSATSRNVSPERPPAKLQKRPTLQSLDSTSSGNITPAKTPVSSSSMFGFFSSPKTPSKQTIQIPAELNNDEFLTLDIRNALFPAGPPDPFSPSAFKNLLINAEGLLFKLQTAYKLRTLSLHELSAEKEAQTEEFEEAEIRAKSLRSQLEDMAQRMSAQEATIKELASELAAEKQARAEEQEARERSIALIKSENESKRESYGSSVTSPVDDLGIAQASTPRKDHNKWRTSYGSTDISEDEDGVFSRSRSPALTINSTIAPSTYSQSNSSATEIGQATFARVVPNPSHQYNKSIEHERPKLVHQQQSTFQKVLKSISPSPTPERQERKRGADDAIGMGEQGCSNCQGKDASFAWNTVGVLKMENKGLKERVGLLEEGVDGALDACLGILEIDKRA